MIRGFLAVLGAMLLLAGAAGAISGAHDHVLLGIGLNGNQNALHVLTGLGALILAGLGRDAARAGCWFYALSYSALFIAGASGSRMLADAFNFNSAAHILHLAVAAMCVWAATYRPQLRDADDRLDLELELEGERWP